ncbi:MULTISPECIES: Stealth CR1 domain-containing protein [Streptococcaceae]|uniref:Capsular polysaccharide phosphotransferase cps12A n=1 Tax=Lactococcus lactis TaxID=1358 RepID=A0A2X0Q1P9_9LACT|nr:MULTISPECIES: Stealth CR1 domain-containing protein [Lactococcus]MDM7643670.1 Stealth CR1 domain-containing protein [Lactococcus lactis]SPS11400.1 Capsular polysaccharide phosphotransferase cps12A [Lactococcus lactis]
MEEKIDFVITWVDGNDPKWLKEKKKYELDNESDESDDRDIRFRDMGTLKYLFRGIEKFSPWVNKIYFVTWGHLPDWLDTDNPKLEIINHKDFIPEKYLPTFNSNTIDLNLYRIKNLSKNFVYFNDDMFILKALKPTDFFKKGLPCNEATLSVATPEKRHHNYTPIMNMEIINEYFSRQEVMKKHPFQWFNLKYGKYLLANFCLLPWKKFSGIRYDHLPSSLQKGTFEELWRKEHDIFDMTCMNKFRSPYDINQWLLQDWQICTGNFVPRSIKIGEGNIDVNDDLKSNEKIYKSISKPKYKMTAINDMIFNENNFDEVKKHILQNFEILLPSPSSFER